MAEVKIFLDKDETVEDVESDLFKALNHHISGDVHTEDKFEDPAVQHTAETMQETHKKIYQDILNEIFTELDKDYEK